MFGFQGCFNEEENIQTVERITEINKDVNEHNNIKNYYLTITDAIKINR